MVGRRSSVSLISAELATPTYGTFFIDEIIAIQKKTNAQNIFSFSSMIQGHPVDLCIMGDIYKKENIIKLNCV